MTTHRSLPPNHALPGPEDPLAFTAGLALATALSLLLFWLPLWLVLR